MIDTHLPQTVASATPVAPTAAATLPDPVADGATTPGATGTPPSPPAGIDPRHVARLMMHPREALYLARLDDGSTRALEPEAWHALVAVIERDPGRRLMSVTAGWHDVIWRVESRE